ncbi:C6 domain-containing protein [Caenorhabditis elegans]|uniref:C6 domain-containing protein n=1 Tax=Caenorhabditis elegans TaxID=6239 RepID=Q9U2N3_CAEEL|nr:C6 domain-containing protein [Caenorhabditis elegans]CAB60577.2 C6 domain-containing protein [Caenorhabditis elegans]|eukprot:NP_001256789.1 Uncharacterized protein CELE_Y37H2A.10 [Caenorhabditis elegans]
MPQYLSLIPPCIQMISAFSIFLIFIPWTFIHACIPTQQIETTVTPDCVSCTVGLLTFTTANFGDMTPIQTPGTDANNCAILTLTCQGTPVDPLNNVYLIYYSDSKVPRDAGADSGTGSIQTVLTCVNGVWDKGGYEINEVECQVL